MKPSAGIVTIARGGCIDTDALVDALQGGEISFAGLDVTDPEPLPASHPLWAMDNVVVTPHSSGERFKSRSLHATSSCACHL
jgi:phosphoglycerate dehydrogenase-like enzyme